MAKKIQYHFVLSKEDVDSGLKAHMDEYAKKKKLTARIKTALTLLAQLEQGNTEMLDTMFPKIREQSKTQTPVPDSGDMQRQIENAVAAGVEKAIQNLPALPAGRMVAEPAYKELGGSISASAGIGSTLGKGKLMSLPTFDDDDEQDTVLITKAAISGNSDTAYAAMMKIAF